MAKRKKETSWNDVKKVLSQQDNKELISVLKDIYSLNKDNKTFQYQSDPGY